MAVLQLSVAGPMRFTTAIRAICCVSCSELNDAPLLLLSSNVQEDNADNEVLRVDLVEPTKQMTSLALPPSGQLDARVCKLTSRCVGAER